MNRKKAAFLRMGVKMLPNSRMRIERYFMLFAILVQKYVFFFEKAASPSSFLLHCMFF